MRISPFSLSNNSSPKKLLFGRVLYSEIKKALEPGNQDEFLYQEDQNSKIKVKVCGPVEENPSWYDTHRDIFITSIQKRLPREEFEKLNLTQPISMVFIGKKVPEIQDSVTHLTGYLQNGYIYGFYDVADEVNSDKKT